MATYHSPFGKGFRPRFPKGNARQSPNPSVVKKVPAGHNTAGRPKARGHHFDHPVIVQSHIIRSPIRAASGVHHHVLGVTRRTRRV